MRDPVRTAVVGYGVGGALFHAPFVDAAPRLSLEAVVTSDPARQADIRDRYPHARVVAGVEDLLRDPQRWDLIVVTVPNAWHLQVAEAAVRAGVSVVVDKPVTPSAADAERLQRLAAGLGVSVIPFHNRRWDGDFLTLTDLCDFGRLGEIWRFESRFERWKPEPQTGATWKQDPGLPGSGILLDLGSHLVDQALVLFGPPATVYAELAARRGPVVDEAFVALGYPNGPAVHLWASTQAAQLGPRFRVLGSRAAFAKDGLDPQEAALRAGGRPGEPGFGEDPPEGWGTVGTPEGTEAVPTRPGSYQSFYAGVAAHLLDGGPAPVELSDAIVGLRVLEAAAESARSRRVVGLGPGAE